MICGSCTANSTLGFTFASWRPLATWSSFVKLKATPSMLFLPSVTAPQKPPTVQRKPAASLADPMYKSTMRASACNTSKSLQFQIMPTDEVVQNLLEIPSGDIVTPTRFHQGDFQYRNSWECWGTRTRLYDGQRVEDCLVIPIAAQKTTVHHSILLEQREILIYSPINIDCRQIQVHSSGIAYILSCWDWG